MAVKFFIVLAYILQNKNRLFLFKFVYFIAKIIPCSKNTKKHRTI